MDGSISKLVYNTWYSKERTQPEWELSYWKKYTNVSSDLSGVTRRGSMSGIKG
jgi:hypothetical protein